MLASARTHTTLPATDLDRARRFYEETVGLVPADIQPGGVFYDTAGGTRFLVFPSAGQASGSHTQIGFHVDDLAAEVADLRARGVVFETYDMPAFDRETMIATFPGTRSAWFKDTEGNLIGLVQLDV
jgi:predicted enzyme related to lactoylglutathione lyase